MRSSPFALLDRAFAPAPPAPRGAFLAGAFAHRGLHGGDRSENGLPAFAAAVGRGDGIECDVRLSRDGEAIVFHDAKLPRMTGHAGSVERWAGADLAALRLPDGSVVPRLRDLLALVAGRVPLLVELKSEGGPAPLCLAVIRAIEGYRGPLGLMSFDAASLRWLRRYSPRLVRGLVLGRRRRLRDRMARRLALWRSAPEFLACEVAMLGERFVATQRRRGLPLLAWTVRDAAGLAAARRAGAAPIYEEAGGWTLPR